MPFIVGAIGAVVGAIGSAAAAVGSFIGGLGFFGQALVGIGLNVASSLLQRAFAKKPKQPPGGVQFDRQYGQDVPRQVACGLVGIAGHDCYINTYGSSNKYLQQVYTLSDYPSDGFSRLAINGEWATLGAVADPDKGFPVTSGDFANLIWIKFIDGRQAAADGYLVDNANPADRWTVNHIGVGITAALISMTFDKEKNNQLPDFFFEFRGARLYDWRKDSAVGGTGAHRWDDPATHEFSENPIVIDYNYRRGFAVNGDLFCGMDMPAGDLPLDKYTAAANICDELAGGETRYRCSVMLAAGGETTHGDNIEAVMLACGGMVVDGVDGSWPVVGSDQPVVMTITDDDLILGAPVQFRAKRSMSELVNSVSGNFPNPDELWSMVGYDPQISEAAIAVDRRTRDLAIDFPQVRSSRQAAQLASIYLKENRYEASATITVRPRFQVLEPGDWVRWNSARYGDRTYTVSEATLASLSSDGPRNTQLSLLERDGSIYDGVTPPAIILPTPPGAPAYLAEVQDFTLVAVSVGAADGRLLPAIRAGWSSIEDETVTAVQIEYFPTAQPGAVIRRTVPVDTTVALLVEGAVGNTEYTVRTKLVTDPERVTAWSAGDTVTTLEAGPDFWPVGLDDLAEDVKDYQQFVGQGLRTFQRQLIALATNVADQDLGNFSDKQTLRRELVSTAGDITAKYTEAILVAAGPGSVLVNRVETLEATIPDLATLTITDAMTARITTNEGDIESQAAAITSIQNTLPGKVDVTAFNALNTSVTQQGEDITANADAITALNVALGGGSAGINVRMNASAGPAGFAARYAVQASVDSDGVFRAAALYIDVPADPAGKTRVVADAGQFIITDGANDAAPFVFQDGVAYLQNLKVQAADVVNLTVDWADITNINIDSATIGTATIETVNIAADQITGSTSSGSPQTTIQPGAGWVQLDSHSFDNPNPCSVLTYFECYIWRATGTGSVECRLRRLEDNRTILSFSSTSDDPDHKTSFFLDGGKLQGTNTYVIEATALGGTCYAIGSYVLQWNKR